MSENFSLEAVEVSLSPIERFEEFLQSRGKRMTQQRRWLVETVFKRHEHFEADDLVEELSFGKAENRVSRPTVYRGLQELVEAGLLRKLSVSGRTFYEHDYGYPQHDHLYCQQCHQLIEFQSDELVRLRDAVARENQFQVNGHRLIITGTCAACRNSRRRQRRSVDRI